MATKMATQQEAYDVGGSGTISEALRCVRNDELTSFGCEYIESRSDGQLVSVDELVCSTSITLTLGPYLIGILYFVNGGDSAPELAGETITITATIKTTVKFEDQDEADLYTNAMTRALTFNSSGEVESVTNDIEDAVYTLARGTDALDIYALVSICDVEVSGLPAGMTSSTSAEKTDSIMWYSIDGSSQTCDIEGFSLESFSINEQIVIRALAAVSVYYISYSFYCLLSDLGTSAYTEKSTLAILDSDGEEVYSWSTYGGSANIESVALGDGSYTLTVTSLADGYASAGDVYFLVESGVLYVDTTNSGGY